MRAIGSSSLVLLALCACSREAGSSSAPTATSAPVAAQDRDPFVGIYRLAGAEGPDKGELTIAKAGDGYKAMVDVGAPGCGGQAKGPATRAGETLSLAASIPDTELRCEVTIRREGETLVVEEGAGCSNFHGAQCDLNGTATRK